MSFDANIGRAQPMIKAPSSMNNDGGSSGNTGYMMRGRRQKKDEEKNNLFSSGGVDFIDISSKLPANEEVKYGYKNSWFDNIVEKFIK